MSDSPVSDDDLADADVPKTTKFDVKKHLIKVQGNRLYLPVAARLVWFRMEHPDWGIETRPVALDMEKQYAIFEAKVYNAEGKLMAQGTKHENVRGFPDFVEKSETGAIGRALAVVGYGTQFAPDVDEGPPPQASSYGSRSGQGRGGGRSQSPPPPPSHPAAQQLGYGASNSGGNNPPTTDSEVTYPIPSGLADGKTCEYGGCGVTLTKGQVLLSERKYGGAYCPTHQKEAKQV